MSETVNEWSTQGIGETGVNGVGLSILSKWHQCRHWSKGTGDIDDKVEKRSCRLGMDGSGRSEILQGRETGRYWLSSDPVTGRSSVTHVPNCSWFPAPVRSGSDPRSLHFTGKGSTGQIPDISGVVRRRHSGVSGQNHRLPSWLDIPCGTGTKTLPTLLGPDNPFLLRSDRVAGGGEGIRPERTRVIKWRPFLLLSRLSSYRTLFEGLVPHTSKSNNLLESLRTIRKIPGRETVFLYLYLRYRIITVVSC